MQVIIHPLRQKIKPRKTLQGLLQRSILELMLMLIVTIINIIIVFIIVVVIIIIIIM